MTSPINEPQSDAFPPVVQSQINRPIVHRRSWLTTIAPAYLGVFIWVPFLDALGSAGYVSGGPPIRFLINAVIAVLFGYVLLYEFPARLGWASGQRLPVVASAALGAEGSEWIAGVLYGFFGLIWTAVGTYYSVKLILLGLLCWNLIDVSAVQRGSLGGLALESPVFLVCLAFWTFIIASATRLRLMNVIAALLKVYAPVVALLLVVAAAWAWTHPLVLAEPAGRAATEREMDSRIFQLVFGYFAFAGLMGVEWGASVRDRRDVRIGGWLGILVAGIVTALAALVLSVSDPGAPSTPDALNWDLPSGSFQGAVYRAVGATAGGKPAGLLLLLFGVAALAPACYGSTIYMSRFWAHWPKKRKRVGIWLGGILAFGMGATALAAELETIFMISGALFAPLAGVITADAVLSRGRWTAPRAGWRPLGIAAWSLGTLVGLAPVLQRLTGASVLGSIEPAALCAYVTAVIVYVAASFIGPKAPVVALDHSEHSGDAG